MNRIFILIFALIAVVSARSSDINIEQCVELAQKNYPLIKKYNLVQSTEDIELSSITKAWLPHGTIFSQATIQNVVPEFPSALSNIMQQFGGGIRGLGKFQYKVGVDINQTIWDGGATQAQKKETKSRSELNRRALDVELYALRQRVESIYFAILLINEQIKQTESAIIVYEATLKKMQSMLANGIAMQSDCDLVEAQLISMQQQLELAKSSETAYKQVLSIFISTDLTNTTLSVPNAQIPENLTSNRPELKLMDSKVALNNSLSGNINASIMPKIGLFAQAYYGYPGIDYFKSMLSREPTFNILTGIKLSWNFDGLYTKKNSLKKFDISNQEIEADRQTFLFNTQMQTTSDLERIRGLQKVIADDYKIVNLRTKVRESAEVQLHEGVIDATVLTTKINDETQAKLLSAYHSLQYLQAIYNLKNTLNR